MRDHVEPIVQVAPEVAAPDLLLEIPIRRREQSRVDRLRLGRADGNHFAMLQHPQQLHLRRRRRLADLVEEKRALRRGGE